MSAPETKPGIKTTEFWLALLVVFGSSVAAVYPTSSAAQVAGIAAGTLAAAGYGFSRALVKRGSPTGTEVNMVGGSLTIEDSSKEPKPR